MDEWRVQKDDKVETMTEARLRERLRSGDLSGTELSLREGEEGWRPLFERPVFAQEVPHSGDPGQAARWRKVRGFAIHLAVFAAVMVFLGMPFWGLFWGIGLAAHLLSTMPAVVGMVRARQALAEPVTTPAALPATQADEFERSLDSALASLQEAGERVEGLRQEAMQLHQRRLAVAAVLAEADVQTLRTERDQALAEAEVTADALERDALMARAEAVSDHVAALEDAEAAHRRLEAKEHALLHRLAGLRLALARRAAGEADEDRAETTLREMHQELRAESEVDDHLARARAHHRSRQST